MTTPNPQTLPWDATDYLKTDNDIAEYLAAAFGTGEVDDVTHALATIARARGMSETAKVAGLSRGTLWKAKGGGLAGKKNYWKSEYYRKHKKGAALLCYAFSLDSY